MPMASDLDPDRILALSYVPAEPRPRLSALWRLDHALGQVIAGGREPMISRIKLAWWRESLERLDRERAPAEPLLKELAATLLPVGLTGADLAEMEEGWSVLLDADRLGPEEFSGYSSKRGGLLFRYSARLLGGENQGIETAGEAWALVDLARHSAERDEADAAIARALSMAPFPAMPSRLRPLGMLAALAIRDCDPARMRWEAQGSPGRMLRMIRYRLTGR